MQGQESQHPNSEGLDASRKYEVTYGNMKSLRQARIYALSQLPQFSALVNYPDFVEPTEPDHVGVTPEPKNNDIIVNTDHVQVHGKPSAEQTKTVESFSKSTDDSEVDDFDVVSLSPLTNRCKRTRSNVSTSSCDTYRTSASPRKLGRSKRSTLKNKLVGEDFEENDEEPLVSEPLGISNTGKVKQGDCEEGHDDSPNRRKLHTTIDDVLFSFHFFTFFLD
eukprot:TRINITY_DN11467_c0_g1_i2.p1 TRINITY_DN11467_c0_g1~~TRINITY_DN11467_c0_g1_i2.p1  ORF type:complete len:221 (+),score=31.54 TRINITY_DN11467_c0_g1_i2:67-729(+)